MTAMDRRAFLASTAGIALVGATSAAAAGHTAEDTKMRALFDTFFDEMLDDSPVSATSLGLDKGPRAAAKSLLNDASLKAYEDDKARTRSQLSRLGSIDRGALSDIDKPNFDSVKFQLDTDVAMADGFKYGGSGGRSTYVLSQLNGAYQDAPDFLGSQHTIETKPDADAYLSRLEALATVMDQELEHARHDVALGVVPPDFVIERALIQMRGLKVAPDASPLVTSVATRAKEKGIAGDYAGPAAKLFAERIVPALDRQIAHMESLQGRAVRDAGVWRLPQGEAYYQVALRAMTTTKLTADEIHNLGLEQAKALSARADVILKSQGYTKGSVGERIAALFKDPKYLYANTDEAKVQLIADLNVLVKEMQPRLPEAFGALPKAAVEIRRVPKFIEAGAPGGYYNRPALDGSRPGIYWINLRDSAENPKWTLKTLTYHESIPGHHLQRSLQQEADLPMLRRVAGFPAYSEGWALYSEELAKEMGVYEGDPLGELGMLQAALFRSARLVVDTGLHAKRWSREKAIATMSSIDGSPASSAATEIERYCVWPGQACSYMVGKLEWLRLRAKAKVALGSKFDIHKYHDAGLLSGAMPLTVLETVVDRYVSTTKG